MFEEEAEEYKDNTRIKDKNTYIGFPDERISEVQDFEGNYIDISERIIKTFKDASEFGYNKAIEELVEKENAELKENFRICEKNADTYFDNLIKAKKIIENIIQVTWGEGWNYSLDWKVKAEQFLKEKK